MALESSSFLVLTTLAILILLVRFLDEEEICIYLYDYCYGPGDRNGILVTVILPGPETVPGMQQASGTTG